MLISTKKINRERRRAIMRFWRKKARVTASFIDEAIIDSFMPAYIRELATEAAFLMDVCSSNSRTNNDINYNSREVLARSVAWFKKGHHTATAETFKSITALFKSSTWSGGVGAQDLNPYETKKIESIMEMMQRTIPSLVFSFNGLGDLSLKVLDHWDALFDEDLAYDALELMIRAEHLNEELNPLTSLLLICDLEHEYITTLLD